MTYEQLDQSIDADSDSDDEIAEQAHLYRSNTTPSRRFPYFILQNAHGSNMVLPKWLPRKKQKTQHTRPPRRTGSPSTSRGPRPPTLPRPGWTGRRSIVGRRSSRRGTTWRARRRMTTRRRMRTTRLRIETLWVRRRRKGTSRDGESTRQTAQCSEMGMVTGPVPTGRGARLGGGVVHFALRSIEGPLMTTVSPAWATSLHVSLCVSPIVVSSVALQLCG